MGGGIRVGRYLLGPFGQPAFVVALPSQLRPEERVEVMNVQQGFPLDSLALALDTVDEAVNATINRGGRCLPPLTLGPRQNQLSVEVDDLVVQPLVGPEASNIPVCDLLSASLG